MYYPKITVVTPSYNHGEFIEQTMLSVIYQNYPNLEYIIIDGDSSDNTVDIIVKYQKYLSYWVSEKDNGQTDALIKGFNKATGNILCWLNSDDLFEDGALFKVADIFQNKDVQVFYGDYIEINEYGEIIRLKKEIPLIKFIWAFDFNYIPQSSTFWRKEIYFEVGGLNASYNLAMDYDLFTKFYKISHIVYKPFVLSRFRVYDKQKNRKLRKQSYLEDARIREYLLNRKISLAEFKTKHLIAKLLRIVIKLIRGSYFLPN